MPTHAVKLHEWGTRFCFFDARLLFDYGVVAVGEESLAHGFGVFFGGEGA